MSDPDDILNTTKRRLRQTKELLRMQAEIAGVADSGGKNDVFAFLSENFDSDPVIKGNFILIGPVLVQFDNNDNFLEVTDDKHLLDVVSRKAPPHDL